MKNSLKVMTILGTRPEIIRLSRVMALLDKHVDHIIVHTGQNYDYELNEVFFKDLKVRKPDHFLKADCSTLGNTYGNILIAAEKVLIKEKPDAVLILGDTNSSIAGVIARRMKIPIYHMEAGNRCFDLNVPEETNRRIIDHISDFNLVYTEHARRNLLREGIHPRRIYLTGSPIREVIDAYLDKIRKSDILKKLGLDEKKYFIVSMHREENVEIRSHLTALLEALNDLAKEYGLPMIVSTHPRTRKKIEKMPKSAFHSHLQFLKPFGYLDYMNLQLNSFCVISDSGTISEESAMLAFPAVTVRNAMERPEAMDTGNIILTGLKTGSIKRAVKLVVSNRDGLKAKKIPAEYQISDVSDRVVKLICGTAQLSHIWDNIIID
jgi:UDP-N-acetylglucosamine 2-epimerase (non-hydrolysing)